MRAVSAVGVGETPVPLIGGLWAVLWPSILAVAACALVTQIIRDIMDAHEARRRRRLARAEAAARLAGLGAALNEAVTSCYDAAHATPASDEATLTACGARLREAIDALELEVDRAAARATPLGESLALTRAMWRRFQQYARHVTRPTDHLVNERLAEQHRREGEALLAALDAAIAELARALAAHVETQPLAAGAAEPAGVNGADAMLLSGA